jgi:hypothetical protein
MRSSDCWSDEGRKSLSIPLFSKGETNLVPIFFDPTKN